MSELSRLTAEPGTLWQRNPVFFQLLGLSPTLAISTSVVLGLALGIITTIIMLLAINLIYWLKQRVEARWHHVLYLIVLASLTTCAELVLQIFWYPLYRDLGVYLPLICCNSILLVHLINADTPSILRTNIACGKLLAGFMGAILVLSTARELLGNATLLNNWQLLIPANNEILATETGGKLFDFFLLQPGALLLLGLLLALYNWLLSKLPGSVKSDKIKPAERARVTGRI